MHTNLKTVSGCATRLTVTVTAPEGADKTLTAYCRSCGDSHQATVEGDTVIFPPLPAGEHLYELRAGGIPVIHGHLISRQSAFPMPSGSTIDHAISATIDGTTVANITVTMTAGPRGPKGDPGLTDTEHALLTAAANGALWLPGSTGSVTLAGQQGDGVAISAANNTSRVQVQDSGVTITARRTPQWLEAGDTPAFHDIRTAKDLTATDESLATALAAKQDTLTPGDGINISDNVISATISAHDLSTYATKEELDNAADMSDTYGSTLADGASPRWVGWPSSSAMADIAGGNLPYMLAVRIRDAESLPQDASVHSITVKALLAAGGASNRLVLSKPVSGYNTATSQASKAVPMAGAQCFVSDVLECGDTDEVRDVVLYPDGDWKPTVADIANVSMWAGLSPDGLVAYFGPVSPTGNTFGARFAFPTVGSGDIRQDGTGPWIGIYTYDVMHALLRITTGTPGVRVKDAVSANTARITALEESAGSGGSSASKVWQALFQDQAAAPWSAANTLRDNLAALGLLVAYIGGEYYDKTADWTAAEPKMYPVTLVFDSPVTLEQLTAVDGGQGLLALLAATPMLTTD